MDYSQPLTHALATNLLLKPTSSWLLSVILAPVNRSRHLNTGIRDLLRHLAVIARTLSLTPAGTLHTCVSHRKPAHTDTSLIITFGWQILNFALKQLSFVVQYTSTPTLAAQATRIPKHSYMHLEDRNAQEKLRMNRWYHLHVVAVLNSLFEWTWVEN